MKKNQGVTAFLSVLSANMVVMLVGVIQTLFFPKLMSPLEYGYWSKYSLYISYSGLLGLGICDGLYLVHGGKNYDELNKSRLKSCYCIHILYLSIFVIAWIIGCLYGIKDQMDLFTMISVGVATFLAVMVNLLAMIQQATARFKIYSIGHTFEKFSLCIAVIIMLVFGYKTAVWAIVFSCIGKLGTLLYYASFEVPVFKTKGVSLAVGIKEAIDFASIGCFLTLAALGTSAMTGIGKFIVEAKFGIEELGCYSFIFSISGLFTQFFLALSTVFFPFIRKKSSSSGQEQLAVVDSAFSLLGCVLLLLYVPMIFLVDYFFPQYHSSITCLVVLLPLVTLQGKMSVIYLTSYKVYRKERQIVYNLLISIPICLVLTFAFLKINSSLLSVALATYLSFLIWCLISVYKSNKLKIGSLGYSWSFHATCFLFIITNMYIKSSAISMIITLLLVSLYIVTNFKSVKVLASKVKKLL